MAIVFVSVWICVYSALFIIRLFHLFVDTPPCEADCTKQGEGKTRLGGTRRVAQLKIEEPAISSANQRRAAPEPESGLVGNVRVAVFGFYYRRPGVLMCIAHVRQGFSLFRFFFFFFSFYTPYVPMRLCQGHRHWLMLNVYILHTSKTSIDHQ